jgi:hypothetical protein
MCHCECEEVGIGDGVAVGDIETAVPIRAPVAGAKATPSMWGLFEQAQASTANIRVNEKITILETLASS